MQKHIKLRWRESLAGFAFAAPAIFGMTLFFLIPFAISVYYSMTNGVASGELVGLRNYKDLLGNAAFQLAVGNTVRFTAVAIPLILIISLFISLLLFKKLRGYHFFRTVFILPLVLPTASVILLFQIVFHRNGVLNSLLTVLKLPMTSWLDSPGAFGVLVVLYIWKNIGYNIVLFFAALNSVPAEFYEAADIDGAWGRHKLLHITIPLIANYFFFIVVISIINSFKVFREAFILCGTHPHRSIYMLQHFMNNNFSNLNYQRLSAGAILVFSAVFLFVLLLLRFRKNREVMD